MIIPRILCLLCLLLALSPGSAIALSLSAPSEAQQAETQAARETRYTEQVRQDLGQLEEQVARAGTYRAGAYQGGLPGQALPGTDGRAIKPREVYTVYLNKAESLSNRLIGLGEQLRPAQGGDLTQSLSLQQLGALTQRLSAENVRFRDSFKYGEDQFESYRLIQTAVASLEDAINYWRAANRYRSLYRRLATDRAEDDEVLRTRLQTAMTAIERLKAIREMRVALNRLDSDTYP